MALIFEIGSLEKFSVLGSTDGSNQEESKPRQYMHIQGLKSKIISQVRNLSAEAGGKGSAKKDLNNQRNLFRDILEYIEVHLSLSLSLCGGSLEAYLCTLISHNGLFTSLGFLLS